MTRDWRDAFTERLAGTRLKLNADVLGAAFAPMRDMLLTGKSLTLEACDRIDLPQEIMGFAGRTPDLRGQDGEGVHVRLVLFDAARGDGTPDCILALCAEGESGAAAVRQYLADFDADLDLVLTALEPLPGFAFCSTGAPPPAAVAAAGLAEDWPAENGLRPGVNLLFHSVELDQDFGELVELVLGEGFPDGRFAAAKVPALVHVRSTGLEPYEELDGPRAPAADRLRFDEDEELRDPETTEDDEAAPEVEEWDEGIPFLGSPPALMLALDLPVGARPHQLAGLEASLSGATLALQLSGPRPVGSDVVMRLQLGEAAGASVAVEAKVNLLTGEFTLCLIDLPTSNALLEWLGGFASDTPEKTPGLGELGYVLSQLLDVRVTEASVALRPFSLDDGSDNRTTPSEAQGASQNPDDWDEDERDRALVQAVGFTLETSEPIDLIPGMCTFAPAVKARIDHPVSPWRQTVGLLWGELAFGTALQADAELLLPSGQFAASATIDLDAACKALKAGQGCPQELRQKAVTLSLAGDASTKSFAAELRLADRDADWRQDLPGRQINLRELVFAVTHEGDEEPADADEAEPGTTSFHVGATLVMPHGDSTGETRFTVDGGWDDGWYVVGEMDGTIDLSEAASKLVDGAPTPDDTSGDLVLADLVLRADFRSQEYSLRGRTEGEWKPFNDLELYVAVERVQLDRTRAGTAADIVCRTRLGPLDLRLSAKKSASDDGWSFEGRTLADIDIGKLAEGLDELLGSDAAAKVPSGFRVTEMKASFHTGTRHFEFHLEGELLIEGTAIRGLVTVETTRGDTNATTVTGGLDIADVHVRGRFRSEEEVRLFAGALALDGKARRFDLQGAVTAILDERAGLIPALSLEIDQLVFAWRGGSAIAGSEAAGFLIDLALGLDLELDLRDALPIGYALGVPRIGLEGLRARYASTTFAMRSVESINELLEAGGDGGRTPDVGKGEIAAGLAVAGTVKLSNTDPLPMTLAPAPAPAPPDGTPPAPEAETAEASSGAPEGPAKWIEIRRALGPLYVGRIGFDWKDGKLGLLLDSAIDLAGLRLGLSGLALHFPLEAPPRPDISLDGLDLSYSGGPVTITGAFLRSERIQPGTDTSVTSYDGMALVRAADFTIGGFGSFSEVAGRPSAFVYAALLAELGGPPFFRVRGIAGGFGYNRTLTLPPIEKVQDFPLVRAVLEPDYLTAADGADVVGKATNSLAAYIAPSDGDYWLAAGVRFNSFELVEAFVLVSVSFGHEVEIGILGLGALSLPRGLERDREIAYAELALRASIKPEDGTIFVEGRLTDASYVLSKDCRLTGGFALFFWFSGDHAGDFVVTLGGYHPRFVKPPHYPTVPRLGIHWQVTSELLVTSEMYFALTPACLMAGGKLSAVYRSGRVRAWFIAYADFLLNWEPLHYTADMGVSIGVEVDLSLFVVHVSLSVNLHLWGPPFGGVLHVDLSVVSFSVAFGADEAPPAPLEAPGFRAAFLPEPEKVVAVRIGAGLMREEAPDRAQEGRGDEKLRVVNAHHLNLTVQSLIPVEAIVAPGDHPDWREDIAGRDELSAEPAAERPALGIAPMAKRRLGSTMSMALCRVTGGCEERVEGDRLIATPLHGSVPAALWRSTDRVTVPSRPPDPETMTLPATTGLSIGVRTAAPEGALAPISLAQFDYADLPPIPIPELAAVEPPVLPPEVRSTIGQATAADVIGRTMAADVVGRRKEILSALAEQSPFVLNEVDLARLADEPYTYFQADPVAPCALGSIGEGGAA